MPWRWASESWRWEGVLHGPLRQTRGENAVLRVERCVAQTYLNVLDHRLYLCRRVKADLVQVDLRLRHSDVKERHLAISDEPVALREGVLLGHLVEVIARRLGEIVGDDDAVVVVAEDLVVVHLDRFVLREVTRNG